MIAIQNRKKKNYVPKVIGTCTGELQGFTGKIRAIKVWIRRACPGESSLRPHENLSVQSNFLEKTLTLSYGDGFPFNAMCFVSI